MAVGGSGGGSGGCGGGGNNGGNGGGGGSGGGARGAEPPAPSAVSVAVGQPSGQQILDWEEADRYSFDDSDRFEEDSLCSWSSEAESLCNNWRGWRRPTAGFGTAKKPQEGERKSFFCFPFNASTGGDAEICVATVGGLVDVYVYGVVTCIT